MFADIDSMRVNVVFDKRSCWGGDIRLTVQMVSRWSWHPNTLACSNAKWFSRPFVRTDFTSGCKKWDQRKFAGSMSELLRILKSPWTPIWHSWNPKVSTGVEFQRVSECLQSERVSEEFQSFFIGFHRRFRIVLGVFRGLHGCYRESV